MVIYSVKKETNITEFNTALSGEYTSITLTRRDHIYATLWAVHDTGSYSQETSLSGTSTRPSTHGRSSHVDVVSDVLHPSLLL